MVSEHSHPLDGAFPDSISNSKSIDEMAALLMKWRAEEKKDYEILRAELKKENEIRREENSRMDEMFTRIQIGLQQVKSSLRELRENIELEDETDSDPLPENVEPVFENLNQSKKKSDLDPEQIPEGFELVKGRILQIEATETFAHDETSRKSENPLRSSVEHLVCESPFKARDGDQPLNALIALPESQERRTLAVGRCYKGRKRKMSLDSQIKHSCDDGFKMIKSTRRAARSLCMNTDKVKKRCADTKQATQLKLLQDFQIYGKVCGSSLRSYRSEISHDKGSVNDDLAGGDGDDSSLCLTLLFGNEKEVSDDVGCKEKKLKLGLNCFEEVDPSRELYVWDPGQAEFAKRQVELLKVSPSREIVVNGEKAEALEQEHDSGSSFTGLAFEVCVADTGWEGGIGLGGVRNKGDVLVFFIINDSLTQFLSSTLHHVKVQENTKSLGLLTASIAAVNSVDRSDKAVKLGIAGKSVSSLPDSEECLVFNFHQWKQEYYDALHGESVKSLRWLGYNTNLAAGFGNEFINKMQGSGAVGNECVGDPGGLSKRGKGEEPWVDVSVTRSQESQKSFSSYEEVITVPAFGFLSLEDKAVILPGSTLKFYGEKTAKLFLSAEMRIIEEAADCHEVNSQDLENVLTTFILASHSPSGVDQNLMRDSTQAPQAVLTQYNWSWYWILVVQNVLLCLHVSALCYHMFQLEFSLFEKVTGQEIEEDNKTQDPVTLPPVSGAHDIDSNIQWHATCGDLKSEGSLSKEGHVSCVYSNSGMSDALLNNKMDTLTSEKLQGREEMMEFYSYDWFQSPRPPELSKTRKLVSLLYTRALVTGLIEDHGNGALVITAPVFINLRTSWLSTGEY